MSTTAMSIKLDSSYKDRLSRLATTKKRTAHALAKAAITSFIEQEERLEAERREAIASYEDYLETGLHVTLAEADEWLESWGTSRLKAFLQTKNPEAAKEAIITIRSYLKELSITPLAHAPDDERPDFRVLIIPFGSSGYKAWYRYKTGEDVVILSIKHQREIGFK